MILATSNLHWYIQEVKIANPFDTCHYGNNSAILRTKAFSESCILKLHIGIFLVLWNRANGTLYCVTQLISFTCAVHDWMYLSRLKLNTYIVFFSKLIFNTFDLATLWYNSLCQYPTSITSKWVNSNFLKQAHTRVLRFGPPSCKMALFFLSKCAKMAHIVFHPELSLIYNMIITKYFIECTGYFTQVICLYNTPALCALLKCYNPKKYHFKVIQGH